MRTVAALYVQPRGCYYGLPGVEPWGLPERDAREYAGPHPVVAHPPCSRWCRLAGLVEARFAAALSSVRAFGGVLEHPAYSDAWSAFDLPRPSRHGGWQVGFCGGYSCHVEQARYGHPAKKATWLYAFAAEPIALAWGSTLDTQTKALVSWCGNHLRGRPNDRPRVGKQAASATPPAFRDLLLSIARSVQLPEVSRAS